MEVIKTAIEGVLIIEPKVFGDARGYFLESFNAKEFTEKTGLSINFVQDNESMSSYGVMRGLHFQRPPFTQSKLVRCVKGAVLDVAVDIRKGSPTYGQHVVVELTENNHRQFFVPRGFAHGFAVLSDVAVFQYKCDNFYAPQADGGISILDESLGIDWKIPTEKALLSEKDTKHAENVTDILCLRSATTPAAVITITITATKNCTSTIRNARTAAIAVTVIIHRSRPAGVNTGRATADEGICCRKRVCQGGQGCRRCGV